MSIPTNSLDGLIESFCFNLEHFLVKAGVPAWRENEGQSVYNLCPPLRAQIRGILINTLQFYSCFTKIAGILRSGLLPAGQI